MADETTTPVTEAVPTEHAAAPVDPNAIEQALEVLAEKPEPAVEQPNTDQPNTEQPKSDEVFEPLGNVISCP